MIAGRFLVARRLLATGPIYLPIDCACDFVLTAALAYTQALWSQARTTSACTMGRSYRCGRKRTTVVVTTLTDKRIWLDVKASDTVLDVKKVIEAQEGFSVVQQRLVYKGKLLEDCRTLSVYKIIKESVRDPAPGGEWYNTLFLVVRGG